MTFGSHTWSHRNLAQLVDAEAEAELRRSREVLEERLAEPVRRSPTRGASCAAT